MAKRDKGNVADGGQQTDGGRDVVAEQEVLSNAVHEGNGESKPKESKSARFVRLASRRVAKALKAIQTVRALGNRNQYEYTAGQRERILTALIQEVDKVRDAFLDKPGVVATFDIGE